MIRHTISSIAAGAFVLASAAAIAAPDQTSHPKSPQAASHSLLLAQANTNTGALEESVFKQINQYRASQKLPALTRNASIDNQARIHSQNMANGKVAFGHQGFPQRVQAIAIPYRGAAENVAYNQRYSDPATRAVQGWLKSSGHLANIKGNYNLTGIGVASNRKGEIYFTQIFIRKA
ncbi:CAP domain-containing protein [Calothrix sp. PCC 7507]|uniref:CAP domain-containing protein n=1 Tax=Calothrix sp. PCC 7507 TaxID=99598 RepID=UPI00029F43CB|nr:CAP domain-containing protein [Calothrix sp. PCC 7507]AFY35774.1 SCP-like extracellular [Calothrix sp. PCC 7507]